MCVGLFCVCVVSLFLLVAFHSPKLRRRHAVPFLAILVSAIAILANVSAAYANDTFASAETLAAGGGALTGTTVGTTGQAGEPTTFGGGALNTQWYNWTAPASGTVIFATCNTTTNSTTNFDTTLGVYTGAAVNALTAVVTNDDGGVGCEETANPGNGWAAMVSFAATAGTTYHIQIDGYTNATGAFTLNWGMPALITNITATPAVEGGATAAYTVVLAAPPTGTVTVTVPASTSTCTFAPTTRTFTMANWNVPQTITATAVNNLIVDGTHTCGAGTITSAGGGYTPTTPLPTITVLDNDAAITLSKISNGGVGGFSFTGTNGIPNQTLTTTVSGTAVSGTAQLLTASATATTITETIPAGYNVGSIACTGIGSGGIVTPNLAAGTVTLDAAATAGGSNITCTFTNNRRPSITLTKTSIAGVGGFTFTGNNGFTNQTITTVTSGTPVAGASQSLTAALTATTITETIPAGYAVTAISCSGLGAGGSATPNLAGGSVALDTAATGPAAAIACSFTNTKLPTVQLAKISTGGTGTFTFAGDNGFGADTITTVTAGTAVNGAVKTLSAAATVTTLTETIPSGFLATAGTCTGTAAANVTFNPTATATTATIVLNTTATAPGNALVCTFTNAAVNPKLTITKTFAPAGPFSVSQVVTYTYTIANTGNVAMTNVQVNDMHGTPAVLVGLGVGGITSEALTIPGPLGAGASPDTTANDGIWSTLAPGATVTFTWAHTVTQAEIDNG